jgi:hypothetical protein
MTAIICFADVSGHCILCSRYFGVIKKVGDFSEECLRTDTKPGDLARGHEGKQPRRDRTEQTPETAASGKQRSACMVFVVSVPETYEKPSRRHATQILALSTAFETHVIAFAIAASLSRRSSSGPRTLVRSQSHPLYRVVSNATIVLLPSQLLDRPPITRQPFYSRPPL